ncbi:TPA: hypothetical protein K8N17_000205 [Clostridium perfringens]|uniref:hypothetical protein n=1 Tax=Clostridium perfringens TaxID=1502 RepID=UPI000E1A606F|nr:hypothetical protein [Clostridium perfringens]MDH5093834.1 hypothetical protein [Clostridium perfringens]MDK0576479.1 hypothetical protein [Clostridium perfringens]MDK0579422.1 hypothetical protein [Clostridium perfringens]SUY33374.1 Uncharacterised protein [Clostridium perfringens]HBI6987985.1 hypothetical protein [Clostridium perfringens]
MKKKFVFGLLLIALTGTFIGCGGESASANDVGTQKSINSKQEQILEESNRQLGMPNIVNFFEKDMAKKIWELRDNPQLTTYAYTTNLDGKFVYLGRCIGFGLPYTTQYTNPEKMDTVDGGEYGARNPYTIPQSDPNGLFSSETTNATWLILVNEETNETEIIYSEPSIVVTQSKLPKRLVAEWSIPSNY